MKTLARGRDKTEILDRLRCLTPGSERQWGRMSVHQMVCHLSDGCRMAMGDTPVSPATGLAQRTIVKWFALYAPLKWPPGIGTVPEIDQEISGTNPADFTSDLAELEGLVHRLAVNRRWAAHPFFGRMSDAAWLRWGYLHMDHHLRQFRA